MKKKIALILTACMLLCSCGNAQQSTTTTTSTATSATTASATTSATTTASQTTSTTASSTKPKEEIPVERTLYISPSDDTMPEAIEYNGGDENSDYFLLCGNRFDSVSSRFLNLVDRDEMLEWIDIMNANKTPYDLEDYVNLYSFMTYFDISPEIICEKIEENNEFHRSYEDESWYGSSGSAVYTDEEIAAIKSGDKAQITEVFARDGSIVIGDKIYNPKWIYNHTIEDYEACGITADMILEKVDVYKGIRFSDEGRNAFESKIEKFTSQNIDLSYKAYTSSSDRELSDS